MTPAERAPRARRAPHAVAVLAFAALALGGCGGDDDEDARGTAGPNCGALLASCDGKTGTTNEEQIAILDCVETAKGATDDASCSDKRLLCEAYCK